jgi:hypothetical protein
MEIEFISLCRSGVGPTLVRFSEIVTMEPTAAGCTRLELSTGSYIIVEEEAYSILKIIRQAKELSASE